MKARAMTMNRRHWLKLAGLMGATAGAGTIGNLLLPGAPARAADYKALVCIFLYGGNDGLNTVVPTDATRLRPVQPAVRKCAGAAARPAWSAWAAPATGCIRRWPRWLPFWN
jgi:uncharacterized protein (DUF1501 family)